MDNTLNTSVTKHAFRGQLSAKQVLSLTAVHLRTAWVSNLTKFEFDGAVSCELSEIGNSENNLTSRHKAARSNKND